MGCFSFMCKNCDTSIKSSSFRGQDTHLFLLKEGEVIQHMRGEYNSYGSVFTRDLKDSIDWSVPYKEINEWGDVCDLMFDGNADNGIAAIHSRCYKENEAPPTTISDGDPDQGWGDNWEYFGETDPDKPIE